MVLGAATSRRCWQRSTVSSSGPDAAWPAGLLIASVGTDGEDGPTDCRRRLCRRGGRAADHQRSRLDVPRALARCDAYPLLDAAGGRIIRTGPTGTNVADIRIVLARP